MEMRRKAGLCALLLSLMFILNGCWNYVSLNNLSIVSGLAVDINPENANFVLNFETIDLSQNVAQNGPKSKLVETEGKTLFDAIRNMKRRLERKPYFGAMQVIVLSPDVLKANKISGLIDWFLRDAEVRETTYILISQGKTAREILDVEGIDNPIVAYEIQSILTDDQKVTSSTIDPELYQVFDILHAKGKYLALPAIHNAFNKGKVISELNGIAVFKGEDIVGYLTPEETKYFLFATNQVKGGILTLSSTGEGEDDVSLEIFDSKTKQSFSTEGGKLKMNVNIKTSVYLAEITKPVDVLDEEQIKSLEAAAGAVLRNKVEEILRKVQTEFRSDIYGFGNMIYKRNPKLWNQLSVSWDSLFPTLEVEVKSEVKIINSAFIKKTE